MCFTFNLVVEDVEGALRKAQVCELAAAKKGKGELMSGEVD